MSFPIDVFPVQLQASIKKMAEAYGVNEEPIAVAMITILSAAIGNTTRVSPKEGWLEPVFIWSMIIGASGSGKTPMVSKLLGYLYARHSEAYRIYKDQMEEYERMLKKVANRNAEFRKPQLLRHMVSDITLESLAIAMESQPRGLLSYHDELSGWIRSYDQYRSKGGDKQKFLDLWSCSPWLKDRVQGSQYIPHTGFALLGGIQPRVIPKIFQEESFIDGLFPRFLLSSLTERPYTKLVVTDKDMSDWTSYIHYCYQIPLQKYGDNIHYRIIPFTPEAHEIFADFSNELKQKRHGLLEGFIPKLISYTVRISGIIYIMRGTKEKEITVDVIKDSIRLIDYFFDQVKGTLALYGRGESKHSEQDERLIDVLKALKEIVERGVLSIGVIAQEFNRDLPKELCLTNQLVANNLIRLGLRTRITKGYSCLIWEQSAMEKLFLI